MIQIPQNGRTEDERLSDFLLLLYMIGTHHNQSRRYLGITKADKFVFLAEKRMIDNRLKGFDYDFYRWNFGPLSPSIYADIETLQKTSMVTRGANIQLTERGRKTLEDCGSLFERTKSLSRALMKWCTASPPRRQNMSPAKSTRSTSNY